MGMAARWELGGEGRRGGFSTTAACSRAFILQDSYSFRYEHSWGIFCVEASRRWMPAASGFPALPVCYFLFVLCCEIYIYIYMFTLVSLFLQDMSKQPPTQELVAKDLHGNEWHFRHIFRGKLLVSWCRVQVLTGYIHGVLWLLLSSLIF